MRELEALARLGGLPDLGAIPGGSRCQRLLEGGSGRRGNRSRRVGAEGSRSLLGALPPELDALDRASEPVQRGGGLFVLARRLGELLLGAMALGEQAAQRVVSALALELGRALPLLDLGEPLLDALELGRGNAAAEPAELDAKLLCPLGGRRLQGKRPQSLAHLVFEVARTFRLDLRRGRASARRDGGGA